jgi:hypothetical protein
MRDSADGFGPRSILNHSLKATVKAKSEERRQPFADTFKIVVQTRLDAKPEILPG